jgi:hypothetical protein
VETGFAIQTAGRVSNPTRSRFMLIMFTKTQKVELRGNFSLASDIKESMSRCESAQKNCAVDLARRND